MSDNGVDNHADSSDDGNAGSASIGTRASDWFLLNGNRLLVGAVVALLFGCLFGAVLVLDLAPLRDPQSSFYLFGGLVSGNLTLITVVVSINQLLLSRELSTPRELDNEIEGLVDYRENVEDATGRLAPVEPMGFLRLLFESTRQEAQRLGGLAVPALPPEDRDRIDGVVTDVTGHIDHVDDLLAESDADIFSVLSVTLTTNYARQIHEIRRIRRDLDGRMTDAVDETTRRLISALRDVDIARQYFKSIYLQDELSQLSRMLLYAGLPAEAAASVGLLLFTGAEGAVRLVPGWAASEVLVALLVVGFVPLALLASFVFRITVVVQRTTATLPFTTPRQER